MILRKARKVLFITLLVIVAVVTVAIIGINIYLSIIKPEYKLQKELYGSHIGKDYRGHVGYGQFQLWHCHYSNILAFATDCTSQKDVLQGEYNHYFDFNGNLYFYAADGYAVVYAQANIAKVLIVDPPLELVQGDNPELIGWRKPENNYRIEKLEGEEFENIIYLDSFDEFTEKEQKQLNKLRDGVETEKAFLNNIIDLIEFK